MIGRQMCSLDGRVVLVVGSGQAGGIGFATARAAAAVGATVVLADLPTTALADLLDELPAAGEHSAHAVDVADEASVAELVAATTARHGRIDALVNAAAILEVQPFLELEPGSWERTFAVNARGQFLVAQAVARHMVERGGGGRIVMVASNVGRTPRLNNAAYAASKAAVIQLARAMALELGRHDITVNALCPGSTATTMLVDVQAGGDPARLQGIIHGSLEQWRTGIPLGRLAEPEEQAAAAVFLASDAGRYISGQAVCVDGGQTLF